MTTNAIVMVGYAVGNAVGPQYWKAQYQPRYVDSHVLTSASPLNDTSYSNHVPWAILSACWFSSGVILLVTRWYLARENAKRDREEHDSTYDSMYITDEKEDGTRAERRVDKVMRAQARAAPS